MRNWTIAKRMAAALGAMMLVTLVFGAISWLKTDQIFQNVVGIASHSMPDLTLAGDIPVSVTGEHSRVVSGDASDYSVVDVPKPLVA